METIRVFISSPGDVGAERAAADGVAVHGSKLAIGGRDGSVALLDLADRRYCRTIPGLGKELLWTGFLGEGRYFVTAGQGSQVRIWSLEGSGQPKQSSAFPWAGESPRKPICASGDTRAVAFVGPDDTLTCCDAASAFATAWTTSITCGGGVTKLEMDLHGRRIACAGGTGEIWLCTRQPATPAARLCGDEPMASEMGFSSDGRWFAAGGVDGRVRYWDATAPNPATTAVTLRGHPMADGWSPPTSTDTFGFGLCATRISGAWRPIGRPRTSATTSGRSTSATSVITGPLRTCRRGNRDEAPPKRHELRTHPRSTRSLTLGGISGRFPRLLGTAVTRIPL
ncbi:MAG: hypothetical protein HY303_07610 [Candidatus Wallbacteria bacterium]|nr:hypothetical protein [Candidatus Wallbacteria bacterium]